MALFSKKELSPFDIHGDEKKTVKEEPYKPFAQKNLVLTTRACVFMSCFMMTLSLLIASFGRAVFPLAFAYGIVLFWCISFRFIENCRTIPANLFINVLPVVGIYLIPGIAPDPASYYCYMPLVLGMTALGSTIKDGRAYYMRSYLSDEVLLPVVAGSASVLVSAVCCKFLFESKNVGVMIILSSVMLGVISLVVSAVSGKEVLLSSGKLSEVADYSPINYETNMRFFKDRGAFALESVVILIVVTVLRILSVRYFPGLPVVLYPAAAALAAMIFAFASGRRWDDVFACESVIAITIIPIMSPLSAVAISVAVDIFVMGFLHTYKRHKIFADIPKAFDGLPILLVALGLVLMAVENVFF